MRYRQIICVFWVGIFLAACSLKIPDVPKDSEVKIDLDTTTNERVNKQWWANFNDENLLFLIQKAREYNTDIQIAKTHIDQAMGLLKIAKSTLFPSLQFSASPQYSQSTLTPVFGFDAPIGTFDPTLNISYQFDFFKKNANERKKQLYQTQAVIAQTYATTLSVDATVAKTYINLLALKDKLALLESTLKAREIELQISEDKNNVGYISGYDNQQTKIQYLATKAQIPPIKLAIIKTQNALEELTGIKAQDLKSAQSLKELAQPKLPDKIPSSILRNRPDIAYAEFELAASSAALSKARANFLPDFNLIANIGAFMATGFNGIGSILPVGALGASILAPIFEGGKLKGEFAVANAQRDEAAYTYKKVVLQALKEIKDFGAAIEWTQKQQEVLEKEVQTAFKTLQYAKDRYESGYSSYLEVVEAQRNLLDLQSEIITLKSSYIESLVNLYQALGSGFDTDEVKIPKKEEVKKDEIKKDKEAKN